ncbi:hypothetical protein [Mesorhizobium sp. WSM3224]|uniref:hypothetical protein n=1 Tax=Mesorhizobium sp. WSM3224 TaxID=1040986 RepID=UPI0004895888
MDGIVDCPKSALGTGDQIRRKSFRSLPAATASTVLPLNETINSLPHDLYHTLIHNQEQEARITD